MVRQADTILEAQKTIALNLNEPEVDPQNPWADDLLDREGIATRLTNLAATQEPPLAIGLHGQWGDRQDVHAQTMAEGSREQRL